jgi:uncharacterized membrane protein
MELTKATLLHYGLPLITLLVLDAIWLNLMLPVYKNAFSLVQCGRPLMFSPMSAALAYVLMYVGFMVFVRPNLDVKNNNNNSNAVANAFKVGFTFGIILYGVFNATTAAIFSSYSPFIAIVDTLWGGSIYFITAWVYSKYALKQ